MISSLISVLKNKRFRYLWSGQVTSQLSLNMLSFVLVTRVYYETHSNTATSFIMLSFAIPSIIFGLVAGGLVDYFDKRQIMFFCNVSRIFILIGFLFLSKYLGALYILTILISIVTQLFIPAEAPSIPNLVTGKELLSANSLFTVSFYLSTVVGFVIAGPVLKLLGYVNVFFPMILLMVLASYFIYRLPSLPSMYSIKERAFNFASLGKTIDDCFRFIQANERIKQSLILTTFSQALVSILAVLAPGFADRVLQIDLADASYLVMGPAAAGLVVGALWVGSFGSRYLKGNIILIGMIITGITLILLSILTNTYLPVSSLFIAMFFLFFLGAANSFISVPANTILQAETESDMRGRIYGVLTAATGGVALFPVIFSGVIADILGVDRALIIIGTVVTILSIYYYLQRLKAGYTIR